MGFGEQVDIYATGIVSLSACAPAGMAVEQVTEQVNEQSPTGISTDWAPAQEPEFKTGEPNPSPCDQDPDNRTHYLFHC